MKSLISELSSKNFQLLPPSMRRPGADHTTLQLVQPLRKLFLERWQGWLAMHGYHGCGMEGMGGSITSQSTAWCCGGNDVPKTMDLWKCLWYSIAITTNKVDEHLSHWYEQKTSWLSMSKVPKSAISSQRLQHRETMMVESMVNFFITSIAKQWCKKIPGYSDNQSQGNRMMLFDS